VLPLRYRRKVSVTVGTGDCRPRPRAFGAATKNAADDPFRVLGYSGVGQPCRGTTAAATQITRSGLRHGQPRLGDRVRRTYSAVKLVRRGIFPVDMRFMWDSRGTGRFQAKSGGQGMASKILKGQGKSEQAYRSGTGIWRDASGEALRFTTRREAGDFMAELRCMTARTATYRSQTNVWRTFGKGSRATMIQDPAQTPKPRGGSYAGTLKVPGKDFTSRPNSVRWGHRS